MVKNEFDCFRSFKRSSYPSKWGKKVDKLENSFLKFSLKISATIQSDHPDRLLEVNRGFLEVNNLYNDFLSESRAQQTRDERVIQAQLFSRLGFVTSQISDLDFATHRQIIEHGLRIGNTAAECIVEADTVLQALAEEIGSELMEIAAIARKDFMRIPNEFVHPLVERTELTSTGFFNQVLLGVAGSNVVSQGQDMVELLEEQAQHVRDNLETLHTELQDEIAYQTRQMNYLRGEVFPILEYSLSYFREGTEAIIAGLSDCN